MTDPSFDPMPIAEEIIAARAAGGRLAPFTGRVSGFGLDEAYRVAGIVACRRAARSPVTGRKIGFTNPVLWEKAGLTHPVWGNMFEETVTRTGPSGEAPTISMAGSVEPKIECEVVVVLRSVPERGDRGAAVARHVSEIGLGFEIVDSPYPGWNMRPADAVAAGGIHHGLAVGPLIRVTDPEATAAAMAALAVSMTRAAATDDPAAGEHVADGAGRMVLGNPLDAVGVLVEMAADQGTPLAAGEVVTTGSLTPPLPAAAGEAYRAVAGGTLPAAAVVLR